ncbi:hypothetical protein [Halobacillus litoralis]|uniref:DUF1440 domain-containing protein n=1 Tax=Halobacillus litoralis TaxID=45668 RepID=A0A410MAE0_9BACI|nr:hypothetical protein [Halobacillus litoralis]QAS51640.1 hypothetical protein HLI_05065 [Halobacillus litoralis]
MIRWGLFIGTSSGIVLGLYMWYVEMVTGKEVYTLLMNVDFIPIIGGIDWPVPLEWFFHLVISWMIGILYAYVFMRKWKETNRNRWKLAIVLTAIAASTYIPLTIFAIKETPALTDWTAILYWLIGHVLYAITLKKSYDRFY